MNLFHFILFVLFTWLSSLVTRSTSQRYLTVDLDSHVPSSLGSNRVPDSELPRELNFRPASVPAKQLQTPSMTFKTVEEYKVERFRNDENRYKFGGQKQYSTPKRLTVTDELFFELELTRYYQDGRPLRGNVTIACFGGLTPVTCLNFVSITKGFRKGKNRLTYKGGLVTKVVRDFMVQMGDTKEGGNDSIFGKNFADESFAISHNHAGWVGMANFGTDSNGSQFYILLKTARWLDGKHVIFGKVIKGMDLVQKIGEHETDSYNIPLRHVRIVNCGSLKLKRAYSLDESQFLTDGDIERVEGDEI